MYCKMFLHYVNLGISLKAITLSANEILVVRYYYSICEGAGTLPPHQQTEWLRECRENRPLDTP